MKKFMAMLISLSMLTGIFNVCAYANTETIDVYLNNQKIDASAQVIDGSTYFSIRSICDYLGWDIEWNAETKTAAIKSDSSEISTEVGSNTAYADSTKINIDAPALIVENKLMVSDKMLEAALNAQVTVTKDSKISIIIPVLPAEDESADENQTEEIAETDNKSVSTTFDYERSQYTHYPSFVCKDSIIVNLGSTGKLGSFKEPSNPRNLGLLPYGYHVEMSTCETIMLTDEETLTFKAITAGSETIALRLVSNETGEIVDTTTIYIDVTD